MAILDYRNTPTQGIDSSPVQRLMNRRTKTLFANIENIAPAKSNVPGKGPERPSEAERVRYFNQGARDLRDLAEGDVVRMKPLRLGDRVW